MYKLQNLKIKDLNLNTGQVAGLPKNPRFIKDDRFRALKKSIEDAPEMLSLRELIVYDNNGEYVIIAGNMRYRACKEIGYKELPCKILPPETPVEKLREYTIKDNNAFGQNDWDILANEWNVDELNNWGMEVWNTTEVENSWTSIADSPSNGQSPMVDLPDFNNSGLPPELQGIDLNPDNLPKIEGSDEIAMERIIIVYPKERADEVAQMVGLEKIDKVVYNINELR